MADSDLPGLGAATSVDTGDLLHVVDISDTSAAADGTDKKITAGNLATSIASLGSLATDSEVTSAVSNHAAATDPHGDRAFATSAVATHEADTTSVHGIADTSALALTSNVVTKALYDAQTVLAATSDNTPAALTVTEESVVGRLTGGNVAAVNPSAVAQTINTQTDDYILVLGDAGKIVEMNCGDADTLTVPPNSSVAFPVGTRVDVVQYGAGAITLTPGSGVTIRVNAALTLVTNGTYSGCTLYKRATNEWVAFGDLVPA